MAHEAVGVGCERLVTPNDDNLRLDPLRVVVAVRVQLSGVKNPAVAFLQEVGGHTRLVAGVGREEAERHVRRTERRTQNHGALPHCVTAGAGQSNDALRSDSAELVANDLAAIVERFLDEVEGLVPRDALPLVRALLALEQQRPLHTVMVVDLLNHVDAAQAQTTLAVCEVRVTLDPLELPVLDIGKDTAAIMAAGARPD